MADAADPVSRETPPAPPSARGVFREHLALAERYAELLASEGAVRGLIGPRETPRLWDRHLLNCAVLAELVPEAATVADLGSGAGLPGLVLALTRPDLRVTLVEPLLRRATFLEEAASQLGLDRVRVTRARAEELHGTERFDIVTSRALAPLDRVLSWSMPLLRAGGAVLAMKGSSAAEEVAATADLVRRLGGGPAEVLSCGIGVLNPPTTVVRVAVTRAPGLGLPGGDRPGRAARRARRGGPTKGRGQ